MGDVNYVITIRSTGNIENENQNSHIAPTSSGEVNGGFEKSSKSSTGGFEKFAKNAKKIMKAAPVAYALRYADMGITTYINRVSLRTGNALLQEKISYQYEMGKRVALSGTAIVAGLLTGNYVAAIGGAMSLVNMGVQHAIAQENINIARSVENIGLEQMRIRAGMSRRY